MFLKRTALSGFHQPRKEEDRIRSTFGSHTGTLGVVIAHPFPGYKCATYLKHLFEIYETQILKIS